MAVTVKKTTKATKATKEEVSTLDYLSAEIQEQVNKLPAKVKAIFEESEELSAELVEAVAADIPDSLMDVLLTTLEEQLAAEPEAEPEPEEDPTDDRQARREALKAQIASNATKGDTVPKTAAPKTEATTESTPTTAATSVHAMDGSVFQALASIFPVNQPVSIINRGGGNFEIKVGPLVEEGKVVKKERKLRMGSLSNRLQSPEYEEWLAEMQEKFPTLEDRLKLAKEKGLKRGEDWNDKTKAGKPMPSNIELMYVTEALLNASGVEKYVEGARTKEERKAILKGEAPMPDGAKE